VSDVAIGGARDVGYTCAKTTSGGQDNLYCWGYNGNGELGDGTQISKRVPTPVSGMQGVQIKQLALSSSTGSQSCALMGGTNDGRIWCWGYNRYGSVGVGDASFYILAPRQVPGFGGSDPKALKISIGGGWGSGAGQMCGLRADGKVLCAGYNAYGQLGDGTTDQKRVPVIVQDSLGQPLTNIVDVLAIAPNGYGTTCALASTGKIYCWGYNAYGQLGIGHTTQITRATEVIGITNARSLYAGGYSNVASFCAVLADSTIKCWGYNGQGELGTGVIGGYASVPVAPL
jgi:alpha-tubulin suppressor-like RCC1 family protein